MCYIRLFFHLLIFSIFYIMYWFYFSLFIWMKFLYYVKYFLKRHANKKIDIVYEPWIEFTYVKSFYVKYRMFSFMRGVSFRVSGTRLSMLADKNNKWIWLEKNIITMQYIHTSCPKEQRKHVKWLFFYRI